MNNIDVSVIIPIYNSQEYISSTLESIFNQDFNNFEIILIDDGSTDNSLAIAENTLSKTSIPNTIVSQKNKGVGSARNKGINLANGDYILFVDGDDLIAKNHISSLFNKVTSLNCDFAYTNLSKINKNKNILSTTSLGGEIISTIDFLKLECQMDISFNFVQLIYKTSILKENNIKFSEIAVYGEDTEFAYNALKCGDLIAISKDVTYFYLQHFKSTISSVNFKRFNFVEILENLAKSSSDELSYLIRTQRIPKTIFGNMLYFFYNDYSFKDVISEMHKLDLFNKLKRFKVSSKKDLKFLFKLKIFLLSPKIYYILWKKFKNSID